MMTNEKNSPSLYTLTFAANPALTAQAQHHALRAILKLARHRGMKCTRITQNTVLETNSGDINRPPPGLRIQPNTALSQPTDGSVFGRATWGDS